MARSRKRAGKKHLDGSSNHQEAQQQPTEVNAEKPQLLYPETESTLLAKDPESNMVEEKEVKKIEGEERNVPNEICNESDLTPPKETIMKRVKDLESEHCELCPKLDPLSPKDSNSVLLPEPETVAVKNETNGLSTEPDSITPRKKKRKRKGKSLSTSEEIETKDVQSEHRGLIPNLDLLSPKNSDPVLLPEPDPVVVKNETNGLSTEPDSATPRKKRKRKVKSFSTSEGIETNDVHSEHHEVIPNLDPLSPKDSDSIMLPEPEPVAEKNETSQLCTEPESATPRKKKGKRKGKSLSASEGTETNDVHSEHRELISNLDPLSSKDSDPIMLSEREPVAQKNETNQICTEPESATTRKKRRKRKGKSLSTSEGTETNDGHSEHCELIPNLDPLPQKDSDSVLLPEPEPFAEKNNTNQLCIEPDSTPSRNMKRKRKRKSLSKSEGVEANHMDSEHRDLCPNLAVSPPKDPNPLLLPEPAPVGEKNEANQLCTKPNSTSPKFEGAEMKDMDSENLELCPKLDPLPHKDSDPLLLPESESAPLKEVEQKKKRNKKKKKNKGELKGEGVKSNRPNDEHSQQLDKAKPTTSKERNQSKRQVMNETHNSSVQSMVTQDYNLRPTGASILNSEAVEPGPWLPKGPLKDYERYERCLECRRICQRDRECKWLRHLHRNQQICFFCGTFGHSLGQCPMSPGAKYASGIIMLDDYVKKKCGRNSERTQQQVAPANVPTHAPICTPFLPSNIQPYPAPFVRSIHAPFAVWRN